VTVASAVAGAPDRSSTTVDGPPSGVVIPMSKTDPNGFRIKPGHTGAHGPAMGPVVWIIRRHDDKLWGPFTSRHDAIGWCAVSGWTDGAYKRYGNDYEAVPIPVGSFRFDDVIIPEDRP